MTVSYLPEALYLQIEEAMPIACVDFVPVRDVDGVREVGLILRDSPHGPVWCHLGGRILRGETIAQAIRRHAADTVNLVPVLPLNPQPDYVYEWFPTQIAPTDGTVFGNDPRKHAIGLSFVLSLDGTPEPQNEAIDFAHFPLGDLPRDLWPGCGELLERLGLAE
ncbi:MAG: DUF4916 domain-containing protein [Microbacterium sp.]|uniref:DUF4916 domain-containing protein n=1 Tax=Microbacterium sp. TaxID=51671 RepID=UPI0026102229|nr:DUF4916 domain-containing protein [Microbacterium sp.]MCX6501589.1 DUF4916 domain-containing protein [Microbacterium sp.]